MGGVVDDEIERPGPKLGVDDLGQPLPVALIDAVVRSHDVGQAVRLGELGERDERLRFEVDGDELARLREQREQRRAAAFGDPELEDRAALELSAHLAVLVDERQRLDDEEAIRGRLGCVLADELDVVDEEGVPGKDAVDGLLAEGFVEKLQVVRQSFGHEAPFVPVTRVRRR